MKRREGRRNAAPIALAFAALLHLIVGGLLVPIGLVAPQWAYGAFWLLWFAAIPVGWSLRNRPIAVLLVPFAVLGVVWLALILGDRYAGWTA